MIALRDLNLKFVGVMSKQVNEMVEWVVMKNLPLNLLIYSNWWLKNLFEVEAEGWLSSLMMTSVEG